MGAAPRVVLKKRKRRLQESMATSSQAVSETPEEATSSGVATPHPTSTIEGNAPAVLSAVTEAVREEAGREPSGLVSSEWGRVLPHIAAPLLGVVWRFLCTLFMFGVLLFLASTAIVWASRQPHPSSSSLINIEDIVRYGLKGKISIAVHATPALESRPPRIQPSTTTVNTVRTAATSVAATKPISRACKTDATSFFCNATFEAWYYNGERCQSTEQDAYKVCPRFIYQHKDKLDCESHWSQCNATRNCTIYKTFLFPCSGEELSRSWYFFNQTTNSCVRWGFPLGACPNMSGSPGFDSKVACEMVCNGATVYEKPECLQPSALMPCPADHMRYPYFYSDALDSRGQCLRADMALLTGHRCVNPKALFLTEAECNHACIPNSAKGTLGDIMK